MSQSHIMDALLIAADAKADGRDEDWEAILQQLEDDGAWDFESWWYRGDSLARRIQDSLVQYYAGRYNAESFVAAMSTKWMPLGLNRRP